eukprot:8378172-Pyramimonas_sp.AAC.1
MSLPLPPPLFFLSVLFTLVGVSTRGSGATIASRRGDIGSGSIALFGCTLISQRLSSAKSRLFPLVTVQLLSIG